MTDSNEFQFFWYEGPLNWLADLCLRSFTRFSGVTVHIYSYDHNLNPRIPGCVCHDANEVLPREIAERWKASSIGVLSFSPLSTMFRYRLLYEKGGWWFDLDCFLVKPLTPLFDLDYVFGWETPTQVNAAVLKFPKNSEILDRLYKEYFEMDPDRWRPGFGIPLFTQYLKKFNLITKALPPEYFYPIYPGESQRLSNQAEETFILHLYASWEQAMKPVKELTLQNEIRSLKSQIDTLNRQVVSLTNQVHNLNNSLSLKIGRMIPFGETIRRAFVKDE